MMPAGAARGSRDDKRRLREITGALDRVELGRPSALLSFVPALRELTGAYSATAYKVSATPDGIAIPDMQLSYVDRSTAEASSCMHQFTSYVRKSGQWGGFDPRRPERAQRNRLITIDDPQLIVRGIAPLPRHVPAALVPNIERYFGVLAAIGWARPHARMLVCDGARLLAYIGIVDDVVPDARQRALLRALVPALRRRLIAEEHLGGCELWRSALETTLEQVGAPAFVLATNGGIAAANRAAQEWLDRDRAAAEDLLRTRPPALHVTPFEGGGQRGVLCIYRGETPGHEPRMIAAAVRWGLTSRQSEVLALLARGYTNARISAELGCAEGTVEIHVSRILERAQVPSRAALIAELLWTRSGGAGG